MAEAIEKTGMLKEVAPGVTYMTAAIVNLHTIDLDDGRFVLVDTGVRGTAPAILRAIEQRYGPGAKPEYIVLTHGHFDHAGSVEELANKWDVRVYAHRMELPFLTGRSSYPPMDPTVGGLMGQLSRFFPRTPYDLGDRIMPLRETLGFPEVPGWRVLHTPGHTPGHVSLFRESDRVLIAGDAVSTVDQASAWALIQQPADFAPPPQYATTDWEAAEGSILALAELRPNVVVAGHGKPIMTNTAERLLRFAQNFRRPRKGRYVRQAAKFDERGLISVPPAPADPVPKIAAGVAIAAATVIAIRQWRKAA